MADTHKGNQHPQQLVVALDTASDAIALAVGSLRSEQGRLYIEPLASGDRMARREANVNLVPALDELFAQNDLERGDVVCVVCGRGPGSFTGVRIAVATAKGLAAGLEVPLFGVATPDALAWQAWLAGTRGRVAVLLDAMRGEVYPARFRLDERGAFREDPLTVIKADVLAEKWHAYTDDLVLTGDALNKYGALFSDFDRLDQQLWHPQGVGLLRAFEVECGVLGIDVAAESATCGVGVSAIAQTKEETGARAKKEAGTEVEQRGGRALRFSDSEVSTSIAALLPVYTRLSDAEENERKRLASGGQIAQGALTEVPASGVAWPLQSGARSFRPAATADVTQMTALEQNAYAHSTTVCSGECWTETMFSDDIAKADRSWWVCYQGNELAGFIGGQLIDGQMQVLDVVVGEPFRRQGIARQLLFRLARDAKDLEAAELTLEVRASNTAAQATYQALGFTEIGRRKAYYTPLREGEAREDAVIMTGSADEILKQVPLETSGDTEEAPVLLDQTQHPRILAIESSCDETAAALIDGKGKLLSNVIASQTDFHARFGGVVPEIASRKHTEAIYPVVMEAKGRFSWHELDAVAVTYAPGLIGALVVGVAFAKGLCWATGLPLIKVNHLEGHVYANRFVTEPAADENSAVNARASCKSGADRGAGPAAGTEAGAKASVVAGTEAGAKASVAGDVEADAATDAEADGEADKGNSTSEQSFALDDSALTPPFIIALLSGGNTLLVHVLAWGEYKVLGETLDDAIGEAYDKVAKALGLGYPGGPVIAKLAEEGNPLAVAFPRALLHSHDYQFSFSGLKTAVLTVIREQAAAGTLSLPDIAASFEQAVIEVQVAKALDACESLGVDTFCIGGGVASNKALREAYRKAMEPRGIRVVFPPQIACTDNAAMIAAVALDRYRRGQFADLSDDAAAQADLELGY